MGRIIRQTTHMRIRKLRFGVSELADGGRVLTPHVGLGPAYPYADQLWRRFRVALVAITALWVGACVSAVVLLGIGRIGSGQCWEIALAAFLAWDLLRLALTCRLFARRRPLATTLPRREFEDRLFSMYIVTPGAAFAFGVTMGVVGLALALVDLLAGTGEIGAGLLLFPGLFYGFGYVYRMGRYRLVYADLL
jgi:hypothetical protein